MTNRPTDELISVIIRECATLLWTKGEYRAANTLLKHYNLPPMKPQKKLKTE